MTLLLGYLPKFSASYELWLRPSRFDRYMPTFQKNPMHQFLG